MLWTHDFLDDTEESAELRAPVVEEESSLTC